MHEAFQRMINQRRFLFWGLAVFLAILAAAGVSGCALFPRSAVKTAFAVLACIGAMLGIGLTVSLRRHRPRPSDGMLKLGRSLREKDCVSLKTGVMELSQGNLSWQMDMVSKNVDTDTQPSPVRMAEILNGISKTLHEAADEFNSITDIPCKRLCYVGADSFLEGWRCAEIMGDLLGGRGKVAISTGMLTTPSLALRRKGFQTCLAHKYPGIRVVGLFENFWDQERIYKGTLDLITRHPDLTGMYGTEGITAPVVSRAVAESGRLGKVMVVGHDLSGETMQCLKAGRVAATLNQDAFAQGYEPVIHLFNHLAGGWQPALDRMLTRLEVVTPVNYRQYWDEEKGLIQPPMYMERLTKPMGVPATACLKIAFIGKEDNEFRLIIKSGAQAAAQKLKPLGMVMDWLAPAKTKANQKTSMSVGTFGPMVKSVIKEGYHGLAVPVVDRALVPYLNEAVEAGIPVITYNSEPFGLRSLVYTITQQADRLIGLSEDLASSAQQVSSATNQINRTMGQIAAGASTQNAQVRETETVLEGLLTGIDKVSREAGESAASAEHTAKAVVAGTEAMDKTLGGIRQIEGSVEETWKVVEELGQRSKRIDVVVELINDIASQVNVLALNAAIEATRAGESGKGFMVVANEIRRLARGTAEATGEVTDLVGAVQGGIRGVERSMEEGLERVRESTRLTDEAKEALGRIRELVEANRLRMNKIAGSIVEMQRFSHQVDGSMRGVASISEQNTRAVGDVNAATQEMGEQFREVAELARALENLAQSEQKLLAKFNVSSGSA